MKELSVVLCKATLNEERLVSSLKRKITNDIEQNGLEISKNALGSRREMASNGLEISKNGFWIADRGFDSILSEILEHCEKQKDAGYPVDFLLIYDFGGGGESVIEALFSIMVEIDDAGIKPFYAQRDYSWIEEA